MSAVRRRRPSVAAAHADWLTLVEPRGPFLTLPVLRRVWPSGLDHVETHVRREVRRRLDSLDPTDPASLTAWIDWVLRDLLGYGPRLARGPEMPATLAHVVAEHGAVLRPDYALVQPAVGDDEARVRLLVTVWPPGRSLDSGVADDRWSATPVERLALLCRATGVELGLATNGIAWTLVWKRKDAPTGFATFSADLFSEEPALVDAFTSVLGARRFFAVAAGDRIEDLLVESVSAEAEVTTTLGDQVRRAVELLVAAISRADRDHDGELLAAVDGQQVYEAAVSVLMRLVFLLYAEERGLFPLGDELYDRTLGASTLLDQLRETADRTGDEPLERSSGAWHRLLALFRAVHGGVTHDRLRIPAYGGSLFDPDRFPFLEGRRPGEAWQETPSHPLPVDDLTVMAMLSALQELLLRQAGVTETRRLTYRLLDVEQIGHVYEGMLDHSALVASDTVLGLVGKKGEEPEVSLHDLTAAASSGRDALVAWLTEKTGKSAGFVERMLDKDQDVDTLRRLRAGCDNDDQLKDRIAPYVHLLRLDLRELPTVFPAGTMYVTQTGAKRDSGTAYTTRELADEVAEHALAPLVYHPGPAEGAEPADWKLRPSYELLDLKVCDPAVGSGAIIVAACRYLAERLVEAWDAEDTPETEGKTEEVIVTARRAVADRCLYGVDRDRLAVEMAKLSLWLVTLSKERPFTFLDHAFRAGDSLLGITSLDQLRHLHLDPEVGRRHVGLTLKPEAVDEAVDRAVELRQKLEAIPVVEVADAEQKARLNAAANAELDSLHAVADLIVGCALRAELPDQPPLEDQVAASTDLVATTLDHDQLDELRAMALAQIAERARVALDLGRPASAPIRRPLHWPLAFPEVFVGRERAGFDTMVGNPPFLGGTKISAPMGNDFRSHIATAIARRPTGLADLVVFFFLRAQSVVGAGGTYGFLATNSAAQGDSREVGFETIEGQGGIIYRAVKSRPWPGSQTLEVAQVWIIKGDWNGRPILNGVPEDAIGPSLHPRRLSLGSPYRLHANEGLCYEGSKVYGEGFVLSIEEAQRWLQDDPSCSDVLFPYISGKDLNSSPSVTAGRWVINFFDWDEEQAALYPEPYRRLDETVRIERSNQKQAKIRKYWWLYERSRPALYEKIRGKERVIGLARVSRTAVPVFVTPRQVFHDKVVVWPSGEAWQLAVLSSNQHYWWAVTYSSSLRIDLNYAPTDCFENFPLPLDNRDHLSHHGESLEQHRSALMVRNDEGLTKTYNRVHDPEDNTPGIPELRELHRMLDVAVWEAYGWHFDLDHGFHETPQGRRFTFGPGARTEVLDRLLELNHERYADEVAAGLHEKRRRTAGKMRRGKRPPQTETLL